MNDTITNIVINIKSHEHAYFAARIHHIFGGTTESSTLITNTFQATTNQLVNCKIYEFLLKIVLKYYRIRDDREFFNVDIDLIKEIFETFNYLNSILDTDEKLRSVQFLISHTIVLDQEIRSDSQNTTENGTLISSSNSKKERIIILLCLNFFSS